MERSLQLSLLETCPVSSSAALRSKCRQAMISPEHERPHQERLGAMSLSKVKLRNSCFDQAPPECSQAFPRLQGGRPSQQLEGRKVVAALPPLLHALGISGWLIQVLLPITGRTGVAVPSDVAVAVAIGLVSVLPSGIKNQQTTTNRNKFHHPKSQH